MSREDLNNFIHAAKHSSSLRDKLRHCQNRKSILELAKIYGFSITIKDLAQDKEAEEIENWFKISKISPVRKSS